MSKPRYCFICGAITDKLTSFYKFPLDSKTLSKWIEFCKLDKNDNVSCIKLCSRHFVPEDYVNFRARKFGGYMKLKLGAFPSQFRKKPNKQQKSVSSVADANNNTVPMIEFVSVNEPECTIIENPRPEVSKTADLVTPAESIVVEPVHSTPKKRRTYSPRYIGDIIPTDFDSPKRRKQSLYVIRQTISKKNRICQNLRKKLLRQKKKILSLQQLITHLRKKDLLSEEVGERLMEMVPESLKLLLAKKLQNKGKYSPQLRSFALTLGFYSSRAYEYVRKSWGNLLPHPSTLRKWYTTVDGNPGFNEEVFKTIKMRTENDTVICNIVIDEMSIREAVIFDNNKFYGGTDLGTGFQQDNDAFVPATNALFFMAVAVNGSWKVPIGYFLIKSLTGRERANLLLKALDLMDIAGCKVFSVTFDGAPVNIKMCTVLGAVFEFGPSFKPWFINPSNKDKIFIFWDPCHMIKLIRNTLGDHLMLYNEANEKIMWQFIQSLESHQSSEGVHSANKLTKKHVNYHDNRMNVKICVQTLSNSVSKSLVFLNKINIKQFEECLPTAEFLKKFNDIFDMLNCRNKFSKKK